MPDKSVDLILTDPPYGTTSNEWDTPVDFWDEFKRVCRGGFVVFSSQPYTTDLINGNRKQFKYSWIWNKAVAGNFVIVKYQPLKVHEEINVFGDVKYRPIMRKGKLRWKGGSASGNRNTNNIKSIARFYEEYFPTSILDFNNAGYRSTSVHPTQKPVELMRYLVETYSQEGDTILDPFCGSGTTCVAAKILGRKYIGIEIDERYATIARSRVEQSQYEERLFAVTAQEA